MSDPLINRSSASLLRAAAGVLRDLHDDGYIYWHVEGTPDLKRLADQLDDMVTTYSGCAKAPAFRTV